MYQTLLMSWEYNWEQNRQVPAFKELTFSKRYICEVMKREILQVSCCLDYITEILLTKFMPQKI